MCVFMCVWVCVFKELSVRYTKSIVRCLWKPEFFFLFSDKKKLNPFQNLKESRYRSCTGKEKPHMVQFRTFRELASCQRRRLLIFYTERILTLNFDKQFDISKDYLLFQNVSMRFGVLIWFSWINCLDLITMWNIY